MWGRIIELTGGVPYKPPKKRRKIKNEVKNGSSPSALILAIKPLKLENEWMQLVSFVKNKANCLAGSLKKFFIKPFT